MLANGLPSYHYNKLVRRPGLYGWPWFQTIIAFFTQRILRGGPKILLHLAACLVVLIVITRLLPQEVSEAAFGPHSHLWHWTAGIAGYEAENEGLPGGLRIVVFGENDAATPASSGFRAAGQRSWTELLCAELNCNSYISLVPTFETPNKGRLSTRLYQAAVQRIKNETLYATSSTPGINYAHLDEFYAADPKVADLHSQVDAFLAMPRPKYPPKETLWIFSFGTWDIWSLSAMPLAVGNPIVDAMAGTLFGEIERVYQASQNPDSIAWSDVLFDEAAERNATEVGLGDAPTTTESEKRNAGDGGQESGEPIERFRVLLPMLLDPSLLPGWSTDRAHLPPAHSKAEQMRNAAALSNKWNLALTTGLDNWVKTPDLDPNAGGNANSAPSQPNFGATSLHGKGKAGGAGAPSGGFVVSPPDPIPNTPKNMAGLPNAGGAPGNNGGNNVGVSKNPPPNISARRRRRSPLEDRDEPQASPSPAPTMPSKPRKKPERDGFYFDLPHFIIEAIMERQLRNAGLKDGNGIGNQPIKDGYVDAASPCASTTVLRESAARAASVTVNETEIKIKVEVEVVNHNQHKEKRGGHVLPVVGEPGARSMPPSREWAMAPRTGVKGAALGGQTRDFTATEMRNISGPAPIDGPKQDSFALVKTVRVWADPTAAAILGNNETDVVTEDSGLGPPMCASPDDHLFFTPFVLSQRAIDDVARRGAEMVVKNESVRSRWARLKNPKGGS